MNYYRCENPDCGFLAEEEPDVCPQCGGTFFLSVDEEELTGARLGAAGQPGRG